MNLAALQRVDSAVTEIIDNASQVALYRFGAATNGWEKTEIEGALFVFAWSKTPRHGFIVMNRLSTTNLLQVITQDVEFQTQSPFLLYKSNGGIFCVWFYDAKECDRIGRLFQSLTMSSSKAKYRQRCASESDSRLRQGLHNGATRDIVTLLSKAKDEYNMKKADTGSSQKRRERRSATSSSLAAEGEPVLHKPTPVRRTNGAAAPSTPLSVASLFAAASSPRGAPGDARDSLMRALLANPDNRLEHVERAQQQAEEAPLPDAAEVRLRAASCQANLSWEEGLPPVVTPAMLELGAGQLASPPATSDLPLLTPEAFTRPAAGAAADPPVPALTKDQLRDALIHMLQTDDGFLLKLHEAYVGSLKCRLNLDTMAAAAAGHL